MEKANRSNVNLDTGKWKAVRYNSQNVLSGLLIYGECGVKYHRITTVSGEDFWRCANRVNHGKEICKHSQTISEAAVINFICNASGREQLDPQAIKDSLNSIFVGSAGTKTLDENVSK